MAIALRGTNSATQTSTSGGTLTVPVPTGTVAGDVLVILVTIVSSSTVPATPSGLTLLDSASAGPSYASYFRVCDGTEPASYAFTVTKRAAAVSRSYSGVDSTNPINAHGTPNKTATVSATATSITTTADGCELVFASALGTANATFTNPTGFANGVTKSSNSNNTLATCDESQSAAGATGSVVGAWSAANNNYSQLIALAPGASSVTNNDTGSGTTTLSGSGAESLSVSSSASGSVSVSGSLLESANHTASASGTIQLTGSAIESFQPPGISHSDSGSGTITLSGSRVESTSYSATASGIIHLSGTGSDAFTPGGSVFIDAASGMINISGSFAQSFSHSSTASGSISFTGSGSDVYVPPGGTVTHGPPTRLSVALHNLRIH